MTVAAKNPVTFLDHLQTNIESALRSPEGVEPPTVILWTDPDSQWKPLLPTLVKAIPHLFAFGAYNLEERTGPVIWLKCIVDRTLPGISPPTETVPILYLPGVDRQQLRAGSDRPEHLQPLVELQYRGTVWHQRNGRDWTVEAFLTSEHGLGLDVLLDNATRQAMVRALAVLATESVGNLRGHRLEADDFDRLLVSDPLRDLLSWMSDPDGFRQRCDEPRWQTFCTVMSREYELDPDKGPTEAGQALREGGGKWDAVWERFCEAPRIYRGISSLLREVGPPKNQLLFMAEDRDPKRNADDEVSLRAALEDAASLPHHEACDRVLQLEKKHAARREWIWSELGESTWAIALEPLAVLATSAQKPLGGAALRDVIDSYVNDGWRCDRAALDALACVSAPADVTLMAKVQRCLYEPWLDTSARHFQSLTGNNGLALKELVSGIKSEKETCVLFADGLRFDVAGQVQEVLEARGVRIRLDHRVAPTPTVTATAKPVASPANSDCGSTDAAEDFAPVIKDTGLKTNAQRLRNVMKESGVIVLLAEDSQMPTNAEKGGWSEVGQLDSLGHKLGARLVTQINTEVETIADRVVELLDAGWTRVKVVTDHGWLLMPGGLRKDNMPKYLTETKWSRCAIVKGESATDMPTYAWHWNPHVRVASSPGAGSFAANTEYSHGGVSVQECVVPELVAERGAERASAKIKNICWRGMRCRIAVDTNMVGLKIDLRLNWKQSATSIVAAVKDVEGDSETSVVVKDDSNEGMAAAVVVLDANGQVLDQKTTTVGGE